jgi:hypothetical protein
MKWENWSHPRQNTPRQRLFQQFASKLCLVFDRSRVGILEPLKYFNESYQISISHAYMNDKSNQTMFISGWSIWYIWASPDGSYLSQKKYKRASEHSECTVRRILMEEDMYSLGLWKRSFPRRFDGIWRKERKWTKRRTKMSCSVVFECTYFSIVSVVNQSFWIDRESCKHGKRKADNRKVYLK